MRQLTAWIACFAVLLAALAPSVSRAIAAANGSSSVWAEICSIAGSKLVKVGAEQKPDSSSPAEKGFNFEHCPFCFTHAGSVGLPPTASVALPVISGKQPLPPLYYQSPRPLFLWAAAQSRAPPVIS